MAVLEVENLKKYVNGIHKFLVSLKKDEAIDSFTFAKLYVREEEVVVLLNAELVDFSETGINVEEAENNEETKVGVSVVDDASYENALKAISLVAEKHGLNVDSELEVEEIDALSNLYHEGEEKVKVLVYVPTVKTIVVKVPQTREVVVTRMVPLTFTQKLVMIGSTDREKEDHERIRNNFDELMNLFMVKNVRYRVTKKCVKITYKRQLLAKMVIAGRRTIKVYLALNRLAYDEHYRIIDCSDKPSYVDVPSCVKVTGRVSLNRAADLINDVLKNFEVPENKKYVSGYSYSKEIIEEYKKSLQETTV